MQNYRNYKSFYERLEAEINDIQFKFRGGLGTRDALLDLKVLVKRARNMNCDVFAGFVDYDKANISYFS